MCKIKDYFVKIFFILYIYILIFILYTWPFHLYIYTHTHTYKQVSRSCQTLYTHFKRSFLKSQFLNAVRM